MADGNGAVKATEGLTTVAMLELLIEGMSQIAEAVDNLVELNAEILEKVNDLVPEVEEVRYDS